MSRNVRTYDHFCSVARTLELVGERWSMLVVRDLLTGPKRFTDLMDRLGGITPKTLTQRLRELADGGVVVADRQPGRREVWYRLTDAGTELGPVVDGLTGWGLRHAWRRPRPGEPLHVEHLLRVIVRAVEDAGEDHEPASWHFHFPGADYLVVSDGRRWSLESRAPDRRPDLTVVADAGAFVQFAVDPSAARASRLGIELSGEHGEVGRFLRRIQAFARAADLSAASP